MKSIFSGRDVSPTQTIPNALPQRFTLTFLDDNISAGKFREKFCGTVD